MKMFLDWRQYMYTLLSLVLMVPIMFGLAVVGAGSFGSTLGMFFKFILPFALAPILVTSFVTRVWQPWRSWDAFNKWLPGLTKLSMVGFFSTTAVGMGMMMLGLYLDDIMLEGRGLLLAMVGQVFVTIYAVLMLIAIITTIGGGGLRAASSVLNRISIWRRPYPKLATA